MTQSPNQRIDLSRLPAALQNATGKVVGQGALMLAASAAVNGLSYLYHVAMGPLLGPARYGEFTTLLGVLTIIAVPMSVLQGGVTQHTARLAALSRQVNLATFFPSVIRPVLIYGSVVAIALVMLRSSIASILHLPSDSPVLVLAFVFALSLLSPLTMGALNGLQRFAALGGAMVLATLVRCVSGLVLVVLGAGAMGALAGSGFAAVSVLLMGVFLAPAFFRLRGNKEEAQADASRFPTDVLLGVLALNVLLYGDVTAVKHFFTAEEAGQYAAAATIGKALLFLPGTISLLLLPKVTHKHALGEQTASSLRLAVGALLLLCAPLALVFLLAPALPISLTYGAAYLPSTSYLGLYSIAMVIYALLNLLLWYYLAVGNRRFSLVLLAGALAQAGGFALFHHDPQQIVAVVAGTSALILVLSELVCGGLKGMPTAKAALAGVVASASRS